MEEEKNRVNIYQQVFIIALGGLVGAALALIVYFITSRGFKAISWQFLTAPPLDSMTAGVNWRTGATSAA